MPFDRSLLTPISGGFDRSKLVPIDEEPLSESEQDQLAATPAPSAALSDAEVYQKTGLDQRSTRAKLADFGREMVQGGKQAIQTVLHPVKALESSAETVASEIAGQPVKFQPQYSPTAFLERSSVQIPHVEPGTSPTSRIAQGVADAAIDFANFFLTNEGLLSLGIGGLPKAAQKAIVLGFGAQMTQAAPEQLNAAVEAAKRGDWQEATKQATSGIGGTVLGATMLRHGVKPEGGVQATDRALDLEAPTEPAKEAVAPVAPVEVKPAEVPAVPVEAAKPESQIGGEPVEKAKVEEEKVLTPPEPSPAMTAAPEVTIIPADEAPKGEAIPEAPSELTHPILGMTEKELSLNNLRTLKMRDPDKFANVQRAIMGQAGKGSAAELAKLAKTRFEQMRSGNKVEPESEPQREIAKKRLNELKNQISTLAQKGGLTADEAELFRSLNAEANSIRFDFQKPLDISKIPSSTERQSTLPSEIVLIARNDLMRNKSVYSPITEAAIGVYHNADTPIDSIMRGQNPNVSAQDLYNAFSETRDAMRRHYGETITLFRATGKQKNKPTQNWATTKEYASQFGDKIVSKDVPIKDVIAVNVGPSGKYHEVIVGKPPIEAKPKGIAASAREKLAEGDQTEAGFINIKPAIDAIERKRKAIRDLGKSIGNRNVMDQTFDAADTQAVIAGQQARTKLDIGTNRLEREAAMAVIEANGDRNKLAQFLFQSAGNPKAEAAVRYAQANWTALQPLAARAKATLDAQIHAEQNAGINTEYRDAYVPHIYDMDLLMGSGRPYVIGGRGGQIASGFKKGRTFDTIFDAIEAGYKPKSMDIGELVEHRVKVGQRIINRQAWADSLRTILDPSNNEPIVTDMQHRPRGPGQPGFEVAPMGYTPREILPGVRIAVHEGYAPLFDALTGTSKVSSTVPGQIALQVAGGIKHGLLAFDTFHMGRIAMRELFLTGKISYEKGHSLLEYSDTDLTRAVNQGLITPEMEAWVRANRPTANLLIKNGLNVGRVQEALYNSIARKIPVIGTFNKWVFEKLTRGAMMQSALIEFERVSNAMPSLSPEQVARKVSRDLNVYFGNLGSQGVFKSKTFQDLARLVALAPNWVESMARTEVKGAYQAAKGLTLDPIVHRTILTGSVGKGVAQGVLAMFIGAQILNMVTRGKPTWENDEKGHKLDAWIPDFTGKTPGFFLSPLSVQAELTHDMIRYGEAEKTPSKLAVAARIAMNKTSPMFRAGKILLTGKDWDNKQLLDDWSRVKGAAFALAPTPIPLSPLTKQNRPPGAVQRQLTASLGLKTEPALTADQQVRRLANDFAQNSPDPKVRHNWEQRQKEHFESDYNDLRTALHANDLPKAKAEYDKLRGDLKKRFSDIAEVLQPSKPITGSRQLDVKFRASLTPEQKKIFDAAMAERRQTWQRFQQMLRENSKAASQ